MVLVKRETAKQFGVRYGPRNRDKVRLVEKQYRGTRKCPFCSKIGVQRIAAGIFECEKCNAKFAARAYTTESSDKQIKELEQHG